MKNNRFCLEKGKFMFCALLIAGTALFGGCITGSELDHYDNAVKNEQKYQEQISESKSNDRETEEELENVLEEAGDIYENDIEPETPDKETVAENNAAAPEVQTVISDAGEESKEASEVPSYSFRKKKYLDEHYEKHGVEMGFASAEEYLAAANRVISNPNVLHKKEKEDNDDVYYVEETNEFVVVSEDGYIRTYFNPGAGIDYYNRQ